MTASSPQHEPTMEEISGFHPEDHFGGCGRGARPPKQDNDVLELTQEVTEEPVAAPPTPAATRRPSPNRSR